MAGPMLSRSSCRILCLKSAPQPRILHIMDRVVKVLTSASLYKVNDTYSISMGPSLVNSRSYCAHCSTSACRSLLDLRGWRLCHGAGHNIQHVVRRSSFTEHDETQSSVEAVTEESGSFVSENVGELTDNRRLKFDSALDEVLTNFSQRDEVRHIRQNDSGTPEDHVRNIGMLLAHKKIAPKQVVYYFIKYPQILRYSIESWKSAIRNAVDLGFDNTEILPLVAKVPDMLEGRSNDLTTLFDALMSIGFYSRQAHKMLLSYPGLLTHKPRTLMYNHQQLLEMFPKADLAKMVLRSPEVLATVPSETLAKFEYAQYVMGIQPKYLSSSNFLSKDILYLETRHKFIERAGLYSTPDKRGVTKVENPSFKNIADTDDRYFAVRVCGLTLAEYRAFVQLYKLERMSSAEDFLSSDDEDYDD